MVLPKLSIMLSLYIQLNLFFLYSFQPYHFLLIFLLSYAISCMLVGIFCALLCSVNFLCLWVISDRLIMMFKDRLESVLIKDNILTQPDSVLTMKFKLVIFFRRDSKFGWSKTKLWVTNVHRSLHLLERTLVLCISFNVNSDRMNSRISSGNSVNPSWGKLFVCQQ